MSDEKIWREIEQLVVQAKDKKLAKENFNKAKELLRKIKSDKYRYLAMCTMEGFAMLLQKR